MYENTAVLYFIFYSFCCFLLVPANQVYETNDGKTIRIEYREEDDTIYKVSSFNNTK